MALRTVRVPNPNLKPSKYRLFVAEAEDLLTAISQVSKDTDSKAETARGILTFSARYLPNGDKGVEWLVIGVRVGEWVDSRAGPYLTDLDRSFNPTQTIGLQSKAKSGVWMLNLGLDSGFKNYEVKFKIGEYLASQGLQLEEVEVPIPLPK